MVEAEPAQQAAAPEEEKKAAPKVRKFSLLSLTNC